MRSTCRPAYAGPTASKAAAERGPGPVPLPEMSRGGYELTDMVVFITGGSGGMGASDSSYPARPVEVSTTGDDGRPGLRTIWAVDRFNDLVNGSRRNARRG